MNYMPNCEIEYGKKHGLKRTDMLTKDCPSGRIVYRAKDGKLYYRDKNHWCGTFEEYCYYPTDTEECGDCFYLMGDEGDGCHCEITLRKVMPADHACAKFELYRG